MLIAFGTRPEYIKVKSLIDHIPNVKTLFVGQHTNLLEGIITNYHIDIQDTSNNRLNNIMSSVLQFNIPSDIKQVLVQGDTTAALSVAMNAFNHGIQVIHLEAGLRTGDKTDPYPEELNRQLISRLASVHLCPTLLNQQNLLKENIMGEIHVVGNTGLDNIDPSNITYGNIVLVTLHRRNNHPIIDQWFTQLEELANEYPELEFILPIHPNPNVIKYKYLLNKVNVIDPVSHKEMINIIKKCKFIISDSGGIQEEASFLRKRIIICRKNTERPEVLENFGVLCKDVSELKDKFIEINENFYVSDEISCPFGDGMSWKKIIPLFQNQ